MQTFLFFYILLGKLCVGNLIWEPTNTERVYWVTMNVMGFISGWSIALGRERGWYIGMNCCIFLSHKLIWIQILSRKRKWHARMLNNSKRKQKPIFLPITVLSPWYRPYLFGKTSAIKIFLLPLHKTAGYNEIKSRKVLSFLFFICIFQGHP